MTRDSPPSSLRLMSVLAPDSEWRMRSTSFGSTATGTPSGAWPSLRAPYTTAGIWPPTRRRRASFLPLPSRFFASSVASISPLYEQRRDGGLFVNAANRLSQEPRDREHHDLLALLRVRAERNRIGHDQLVERRVLDAVNRRSRQHAVHGARERPLRPRRLQRARALLNRARGVDDVVLEDADAALHVADDVHHLPRAVLRAPFVDDREFRIDPLRVGAGAFGAARVRRHDGQLRIGQPREVLDDHRR